MFIIYPFGLHSSHGHIDQKGLPSSAIGPTIPIHHYCNPSHSTYTNKSPCTGPSPFRKMDKSRKAGTDGWIAFVGEHLPWLGFPLYQCIRGHMDGPTQYYYTTLDTLVWVRWNKLCGVKYHRYISVHCTRNGWMRRPVPCLSMPTMLTMLTIWTIPYPWIEIIIRMGFVPLLMVSIVYTCEPRSPTHLSQYTYTCTEIAWVHTQWYGQLWSETRDCCDADF